MRKAVRPVAWEGAWAQSHALDPIQAANPSGATLKVEGPHGSRLGRTGGAGVAGADPLLGWLRHARAWRAAGRTLRVSGFARLVDERGQFVGGSSIRLGEAATDVSGAFSTRRALTWSQAITARRRKSEHTTKPSAVSRRQDACGSAACISQPRQSRKNAAKRSIAGSSTSRLAA